MSIREFTRTFFWAFVCCAVGCNDGRISRMDEFKLRSECAARAEKVLAEPRWGPIGDGLQVKNGKNHYNVQLNRCFVSIYTVESGLAAKILVDAYEDSILIYCSLISSGRSCTALDVPLNPDEAEKRIKNYMEN